MQTRIRRNDESLQVIFNHKAHCFVARIIIRNVARWPRDGPRRCWVLLESCLCPFQCFIQLTPVGFEVQLFYAVSWFSKLDKKASCTWTLLLKKLKVWLTHFLVISWNFGLDVSLRQWSRLVRCYPWTENGIRLNQEDVFGRNRI